MFEKNIPQTYEFEGKEHTYFVDAFRFALSNKQTEIVKFLIDSGAVDMNPGSDAPFMAIRSNNMEVFSYMVEKGVQIEKSEDGIKRLFLNLMDAWDDAYFPFIEKLNLPIKECGGPSLCSAAFHGHMKLAEYLLSCGVSVNYREKEFHSTPILNAAEQNHLEMVKFLVEHGADLSLKDDEGIRPYLAAKKNKNKEMADYLRNGNLKLEFPKEERLHWIKLFSYMDVPEMTYRGKKLFSLVEESEDYGLVLVWEPQSRKIWFIDMEHEVFHAVSTWSKFIENPGYYANRVIMHEFDLYFSIYQNWNGLGVKK